MVVKFFKGLFALTVLISSTCVAVEDFSQSFEPNIFVHAHRENLTVDQILDLKKRYAALAVQPSAYLKIPAVNHAIWLTNPDQPKEMRPRDKHYMEKRINLLNQDPISWTHVLWTNAIEHTPETLAWAVTMGVVVRNIFDPVYGLQSAGFIPDLVEKKQLGIAADFLRFDFLHREGGFYADVNYMLHQSPLSVMKTYDFIVHSDRGGVLVDVYMIAAKPRHPILVSAFEMTLRNLIHPPAYVQHAHGAQLHPQEYTGVMTYWPFNFSFFKYVNQNTTDWAYPLATKSAYPSEAKQHSLFGPEWDLEGMCADSQEERSEEQLVEFYENYIKNEICVESILGWDSREGDSWLPEGVLPQYAD